MKVKIVSMNVSTGKRRLRDGWKFHQTDNGDCVLTNTRTGKKMVTKMFKLAVVGEVKKGRMMKRYKINRCIPFPGNQVEYWIFDREKEVETCGKIRIRSIARMICDTLNRANELHKQRNW